MPGFHPNAALRRTQYLPIPDLEPSRSRYRVWSGSTSEEVRFSRISKKDAWCWYRKAIDWNRKTRAPNRRGGGIGLPALQVLYCFIEEFLNYRTGQLDPSYDGIARKTGLARSAVANALVKLKRLRIISWVRRCIGAYEDGTFTLRQKTNAYALLPPSQWFGHFDFDNFPPPWPEAAGAAPTMPDLVTQAMTAHADGASIARKVSVLDADPNDELAKALAGLGSAFLAKNPRS
jgi:hypothetical protein